MTITLSTADLGRLSDVVRLLVSPLEHDSVDHWRRAVNREVKAFVGADSAGFMLAMPDAPLFYSEEHDPDEIARYPDVAPPPLPDGTPLWDRMLERGSGWLPDLYTDNGKTYYRSTYFNEFAGANYAADTLFAMAPLRGSGPLSMGGLHLWHERPNGRTFGEREQELLRLLFPALRAGMHAQLRFGAERKSLLNSFDALEQAVLVCDHAGTPQHRTAALSRLVDQDPEGALVMLAVQSLARDLAPRSRRQQHDVVLVQARSGVVRQVRTERARYVMRGCAHGHTESGAPLAILVTLDCCAAPEPTLEELQERFGFTPTEAKVARLLADGKATADIASALEVSPHTVRRHTERVFQKLGVKRRAAVAAALLR